MKKIIVSGFAFCALLATQSCKTDFDTDVSEMPVTAGSANFAKYVALGNSLTAGYRDGALYTDGQMESYPNIVATQMKLAGGAAIFKQPLMADNLGGIPSIGFKDKYVLVSANGSLTPFQSPTIQGTTTLASIYSAGPYQNMGVPGAKSFHLGAPGYGNPAGVAIGAANPYFARFASSITTTVIADAVAQAPTFFSLWIGNNDVLSYATSGGVGIDQNGNTNPATYGSNDITDSNVLAGAITSYVNALTANGAKGVVANIPYVTSIPYFTRIPAKPITNLTDTQVGQLNGAYAQYNAGLATAKSAGLINDAEYQARLIKFTAGNVANGAVIKDKDLTNLSALGLPSYRQTVTGDYLLLTASPVLQAGGGTSTQLDDQYVLTAKEAAKVINATNKYNASIKSIADSKGLAFVDANTKMTELASNSGIMYDGVRYTATFVTGGSFSLDGVHLTGRGYAVIANEFIKAINAKYGSTLPLVAPGSYSGVKFP